jgi:flagellar hook assembly protein FlgD
VTSTLSPYVPYYLPGLLDVVGVYPNPFRDHCSIYFKLSSPATVTLSVYNVAGEKVRTKKADYQPSKQLMDWAGDNNNGARCASGYYVMRMSAQATQGGQSAQQWLRVVILR